MTGVNEMKGLAQRFGHLNWIWSMDFSILFDIVDRVDLRLCRSIGLWILLKITVQRRSINFLVTLSLNFVQSKET